MEDAGGQHGIGAANGHAIGQIFQIADTARCDHGHGHGIGHGTRELQIEAALGAVLVHAGQQDLAGTTPGHLLGPAHHVQPHVLAPAMTVHIPARPHGCAAGADALLVLWRAAFGVDGHHDALRAVLVAAGIDSVRVGNGGGVEAGLVGSGIEQAAHIFDAAHATAHGQRNEDLRSHGLDDGQDQVATIAGGRDVQKSQLIRTLGVVACGNFHRVARIAQLQKIDALDHAAAGHVKAGNDAFGKHGPVSEYLRTRRPKIPRHRRCPGHLPTAPHCRSHGIATRLQRHAAQPQPSHRESNLLDLKRFN